MTWIISKLKLITFGINFLDHVLLISHYLDHGLAF